MIEMVLHAVDWYNSKTKNSVTDFIILQPTTAIASTDELADAIRIYAERRLKVLLACLRL